MPHGGSGHGPSKGAGTAKKGTGGACNAPTKPLVHNVPADAEPVVISNTRPDIMCPELFEACRAGKVERVRLLLSHEGVDASATDYYGKTCFHSACLAGQEKVLETLLEEFPALLDQNTDNGTTALMYACEFGQIRIAWFLLLRKVDPHALSKDGSTALMKASETGSSECVEFLLREAKVEENSRNEEGYTALLCAAQKGHTAVVKTLLDAGADASAKLVVGTSAKALAQASGHEATAKALELHSKLKARKAAKGDQAGYAAGLGPAASVEDGRSLEDIMAELEGDEPEDSSNKKKKKSQSKKQRQQQSHCESTPAAEDSDIIPAIPSASQPTEAAPASRPVQSCKQQKQEEKVGTIADASVVLLTMTCKVVDENAAIKVDAAWKDAVQHILSKVSGIVSIERVVCKKEWAYGVTVKFEDQHALAEFLASDVMNSELHLHVNQLSHLYVGGKKGFRWQQFAIEKLL